MYSIRKMMGYYVRLIVDCVCRLRVRYPAESASGRPESDHVQRAQ